MRFYTNVTTSGKKILVREIDPERAELSVADRVEYQPTLYTLSKYDDKTYKSIYDVSLQRHEFADCMAFWEFRKKYSGVDDFPIYGDVNPAIQFISDEYKDDIEFDFNMIRTYYLDIEVYTHDGKFPEPDEAKYPVSAISIYDNITGVYFEWGLEYEGCWKAEDGYNPNERHADKQVAYLGFTSEKEMLAHFLRWWKKNCPDIVTGWNIRPFDIPYLINRIANEYMSGEDSLDVSMLSPWSKIREDTMDNYGKPQQVYRIEGVAILDYLEQYKKHSFTPRESYKLDNVARAEKLTERKMSYDEAAGLHGLYKNDYQAYLDYNIQDSHLVRMMEEKRGILFLIVAAAYRAKCNYEDIISPLRTWDALIYNYLKGKNIFCPPRGTNTKSTQYTGAYVKEPLKGRKNWVVSVDLASLYPSLIRQINISPETLVKGSTIQISASIPDLINQRVSLDAIKSGGVDYSMAANGTLYRKDVQGFLPVLLESLYLERKAEKQKMLEAGKRIEHIKHHLDGNAGIDHGFNQDDLDKAKKDKLHWHTMQYAKKILLNSCYGALGSIYFRMYDVRLAEAVTLSGQVAIQWIERELNEYFNVVLNTKDVDYVIYIDTDGLYLNMEPIVEKYMQGASTQQVVDGLDQYFDTMVSKVMTDAYQELFEYMNNREQLMFMDRECIADVGIWSAKKRYMLNVHDNEGVRYEKPKPKIMGYSMIKSSLPELCRDKLKKEFVPVIINGTNDELIGMVKEFRQEWRALPADEISRPTSVRNLKKYEDPETIYGKGSPGHVRAAILYNHFHAEMNLGAAHDIIHSGDKIKWIYLKTPNPIGDNVIAFHDFLPHEFGLDAFVDHDLMFQKLFLQPLEEVTIPIDWTTKKVTTLDFFLTRQIKSDKTLDNPEQTCET